MIYELKDTMKAAPVFEGWSETLIYSCLQQVMGKVLVTDEENPKSAAAYVGCFCFFAGTPDRELLEQITDLVAAFESKEKYLKEGRGVVLLKEGRIVAGASSYTRYKEGIEIEVDTIEEERRKHLATAACANLILNCLEEGLYPSWDAQNLNSVALSKTLGYEFDHEYSAYELCS